jgi:hypothetical protein
VEELLLAYQKDEQSLEDDYLYFASVCRPGNFPHGAQAVEVSTRQIDPAKSKLLKKDDDCSFSRMDGSPGLIRPASHSSKSLTAHAAARCKASETNACFRKDGILKTALARR